MSKPPSTKPRVLGGRQRPGSKTHLAAESDVATACGLWLGDPDTRTFAISADPQKVDCGNCRWDLRWNPGPSR